ncbi:hypothetical protein EJP77_15465 [Paenibacillus zeisoli]|uniref:Photosynthesis system II assembly factor Ycf48/Hcf136-like domain-containing protein n=1 Tax=Paenibacillus zeisoli TaxID=2496267 RepID=A0A3S1B460_9BACL|nr:hypothetical protein [Paenibacillus zeisoli]RUT29118.1 hypothetical protein EJP77_15465 [Paenibacillus zeisoli]
MKLKSKWMYVLLSLTIAVTASACSGSADSNNGVNGTPQNIKSNQGTDAAGQGTSQSTGQGTGDVKQGTDQSSEQGMGDAKPDTDQSADQSTGQSSAESVGTKNGAVNSAGVKGAKSAQIQALLTGFKLVGDRTIFTWGKASKGSVRVYRSGDAGKTWTDISPSPAVSAVDADSTFAAWDERHLLLLSAQNNGTRKVMHSKDGGKTWSSGPVLPYAINAETALISSTQGYLLTESDAAMGHSGKTFYKTANGGVTWTKVMDNSEASLPREEEAKKGLMPQYGFTGYGVSFRDLKHGWVPMQSRDGVPRLVRTTDGGVSWKLVDLSKAANWDGNNPQITAAPVFFGKNHLQGWMPLSIHKDKAYDIGGFRTRDGGESWVYLPFEQNIPEGSRIADCSPVFVSPDKGWFWNGTELKTTVNGAKSWQVLKVNSEFKKSISSFPEMKELQFTDARHGWVLLTSEDSEHSRLLKTEDGGITWEIV